MKNDIKKYTKDDLAALLADKFGDAAKARAAIDTVVDGMKAIMSKQDSEVVELQLTGLGVFSSYITTRRNAWNPQTMEKVESKPRRRIAFRASTGLVDKLSGELQCSL